MNGVNMNILDMDFVEEATGYYVHTNDYLGCQAFRTDDHLMTSALMPFGETYDYGDLAMVSYNTLFMIDREARIFRFEEDSFQVICNLPVEIPLFTDKPDLFATDGQHLHLVCRDVPEGEYKNDLILRSSDGGFTWDTTFLSATIHLNAVKLSDQGTGFAVGDAGGMLRTTDGGDTWEWLESPASPSALKFPEKNYTVILKGYQFYRTNIKWITGVPAVSQQDGPFHLVPNPAAGQTTLIRSGDGSTRGHVTLLSPIGDIIGSFPLEGVSTQIDCSMLSSGLYFVTVESGGNRQLLKLLIRQGR
jgi:hypothetical protein